MSTLDGYVVLNPAYKYHRVYSYDFSLNKPEIICLQTVK